MTSTAVIQAVDAFVADVNRGAVDAAMEHYRADAAFIPEPGRLLVGKAAIRAALAELVAAGATIVTRDRRAVCSADVALYQSSWELVVGGRTIKAAESADVLRRGTDGRWRIAIDNPWGSALLAAKLAA